MKKFLIALTALILSFGAQAQLRTSRTFIKSKSNSRTEWIIRAGLNINKLTGLYYEDDNQDAEGVGSKAGFEVDFGFNKYFGNSNLYWGMELGIGTRGTSIDLNDWDWDDEEKLEGGVTFYNVKYSPLTIGYKFPIGDMLKVDPHLGAYVSYDFTGSANGDLGWVDHWEKLDAGIQAGVGVWYGRFNLDFMYQAGFIKTEPYIEYEDFGGGKTGNFLIRVGVSF